MTVWDTRAFVEYRGVQLRFKEVCSVASISGTGYKYWAKCPLLDKLTHDYSYKINNFCQARFNIHVSTHVWPLSGMQQSQLYNLCMGLYNTFLS